MLRVLLVILGLVVVSPVTAGETSHFKALFGELLARYWRPVVTIHDIETTVFDYGLMQREAKPLMDEIVVTLERVDPSTLGKDNEAKAFWINVYNFAAMRMVVDAYPVASITSFKISLIKHPWSKKSISVGGRRYSLSEIEREILLPGFNDPRIVFAVSCAAVSCADRGAEPFDGTRLDEQMDGLIRHFFRNPKKGLSLNRETNTLTLSWILEKDRDLFQGDDAGVMAFVIPYLDKTQQGWLATHMVKVGYFDHDWTLNDLARADRR